MNRKQKLGTDSLKVQSRANLEHAFNLMFEKKREESPAASDEEYPYGRAQSDAYYNDGYNDGTLSKKAKVSKRKRQKDKAPEPTRRTSSYVMKLFDRSVDMTQFLESAPLYAVCRAWIKNTPNSSTPFRSTPSWDRASSARPSPVDRDLSDFGSMVNKCCVPNCTSNYVRKGKSTSVKPCYISSFDFPGDEVLKNKWIRRISRENLVVSKNTVVCELHFKECDLTRYKVCKKKGATPEIRQRPKLKPGAVPSIFPNCPSYLSESGESTQSSPSKRRLEEESQEALTQSWIEEDNIYNLEDLHIGIEANILDRFRFLVCHHHRDSYLLYRLTGVPATYDIETDENLSTQCPQIDFCVQLSAQLKVKVWKKSRMIPLNNLKWIIPHGKIERWSQLENIISRYALVEETDSQSKSKYIDALLDTQTPGGCSGYPPSFLVEQKSEMGNVYELPLPVLPAAHSLGGSTSSPPRPTSTTREEMDKEMDTKTHPLPVPSSGLLLQEHMHRWKVARRCCKDRFWRSLKPYENNFAILHSTCKEVSQDGAAIPPNSTISLGGPL